MQSITFKEALETWIAYGFSLNLYIRDPAKIPPDVEQKIAETIKKLDALVESSTISTEEWLAISDYQKDSDPKLYRAVWGSFAKSIIDDMKTRDKQHLLADPGFQSWTSDIDIALDHFSNGQSKHNLRFQTGCYVGEQAYLIGGYAQEILFPRNKCWEIVDCETIQRSGRTIILLTAKEYI